MCAHYKIHFSLPLAPRSLGHQDPEEMTDEPLSSAGTCNKHKRQQQKGGKKINDRGELEGGVGRTTSAVINHSSKSDYCVLWICLCLLNMFKKKKKTLLGNNNTINITYILITNASA